MSKQEIKRRYQEGFDDLTPDVFNKILAQTNNEDIKEQCEVHEFPREKSYRWVVGMSAIIFAGFAIFLGSFLYNNQIVNTLVVDTKANIEINIKRNGMVKSVIPKNNKELEVLTSIESENLSDVVQLVLNETKEQGYLEDDGVILLSMEKGSNESILQDVSSTINEVMYGGTEYYSVICQVYESSEELLELAYNNNISLGRAAFCTMVASRAESFGIGTVEIETLCNETLTEVVKSVVRYNIEIEKEDSIIWDGEEVEKYKDKVLDTPESSSSSFVPDYNLGYEHAYYSRNESSLVDTYSIIDNYEEGMKIQIYENKLRNDSVASTAPPKVVTATAQPSTIPIMEVDQVTNRPPTGIISAVVTAMPTVTAIPVPTSIPSANVTHGWNMPLFMWFIPWGGNKESSTHSSYPTKPSPTVQPTCTPLPATLCEEESLDEEADLECDSSLMDEVEFIEDDMVASSVIIESDEIESEKSEEEAPIEDSSIINEECEVEQIEEFDEPEQ